MLTLARGQGAERRRDVDRPHHHLPRRHVERDLQAGLITEASAGNDGRLLIQLRIVRFTAHAGYDQLFSGDPTWVTGIDRRYGRMVARWCRIDFRILQHPVQPRPGPGTQPHRAVVGEPAAGLQDFPRVSIDTCSVQYENDDLMRPYWGDDYGIACCVSAMRIGKQMQFFPARAPTSAS